MLMRSPNNRWLRCIRLMLKPHALLGWDPSSSTFQILRASASSCPPTPVCASNPLLFIGFPLCHPCFLFLKESLNLCEVFFMLITISLLLAFLWIFHILIWILDEKIMSFFLYLALHIHALLFFPLFSLFFFYFWKPPPTLYPSPLITKFKPMTFHS